MGVVAPRPGYRARQFFQAIAAPFRRLDAGQWESVAAVLPPDALALYRRMPRHDQRHAYQVMAALQAGEHAPSGRERVALLQAALLHDVAKHLGGVTLAHRVAAVLVKAVSPVLWSEWTAGASPPRSRLRAPFWAHAHHPEIGARLAAQAGCDPLAVALIAHHQEGNADDPAEAALLPALRAADDDN